MKKQLLLSLLVLLSSYGFSQPIFDTFGAMKEVTSIVVNKNMFTLLTKMDAAIGNPKAKAFIDIARNLDSLKVFTTESLKIGADMQASVRQYLKSSKMEEFVRVNDARARARFYIKPGKDEDHVSELLMLASEIQTAAGGGGKQKIVLLSLKGDIDLNKIGALTQKMKLPKVLNEAGKKQ